MEPPHRELPPDNLAPDEFYLWCAALLEHGHPLPMHSGRAEGDPAASATEQSSSTYLQVMEGMQRVRASRGARAPGSEQRPTLETLRPLDTASAGSANTWSPRKKSAAASRRRALATVLFALVSATLAVVAWQFGVPKRVTTFFTPAATLPPAVPDIPVAEIPRTLAASREPSLPPNAGDSEQQAQRADNVTHAGEILAASGELPEALRLYRQGLAIRRDQAARDPDNVPRQHALAVSWAKVADLLKLQGDANRALGSYRAAEGIEQRCVRAQPDNQEVQRELFFDALNVGDLLLAQNDPAGALEAFRRGAAVQRVLCDQNPQNAAWQCDLAASLQRVADALDLVGDDEGALQEYQNALTIDEALVIHDPSNGDWQNDLAITRCRVGDRLLARNETDGALSQYGDALTVVQKLVDLDAANADWQRELAETHDRIGQALEAKKHPDEALPPCRQALAIAKNLAAQNPADGALQSLVASISYHLGRATAHCQPADIPGARGALESARDLLVNLRSVDGTTFSREQAEMLNDTERLLARIGP